MDNQPKKLQLEITGMTCEHCARSIENKLSQREGVKQAVVNFAQGKGEATFDPQAVKAKELVEAVNSM